MSRIWFLGTRSGPPTETSIVPIGKAFLPQTGTPSISAVAGGLGFPFLLADNQLAEWWYRFRRFSVAMAVDTEGTEPGSGDTVRYVMNVSGDAMTPAADERALVGFGDAASAQNGFPFNATGTLEIFRNGSLEDTVFANMMGSIRFSAPTDFYGNPTVRYYYRTDLELWIPYVSIDAEGGGAVQFTLGTTSGTSIIPGTDIKEVGQTMTVNGTTALVSTGISDWLDYNSFTYTITPVEWWSYTGIYNTATGAINPGKTPFTQSPN